MPALPQSPSRCLFTTRRHQFLVYCMVQLDTGDCLSTWPFFYSPFKFFWLQAFKSQGPKSPILNRSINRSTSKMQIIDWLIANSCLYNELMDGSVKGETESPWLCPDCGTPCNHSHCDKCLRPRPHRVSKSRQAREIGSLGYGTYRKIGPWQDLSLSDKFFRTFVYCILISAAFFAILLPLFHLAMSLFGRQ